MSGSSEDPHQRLARNINDLLQELRVAQAGVQILFGFLLSIVFTYPYQRATALQHGAHLVAVLFAVFLLADVVLGDWPATLICALTMAGFGMLWFAVPLRRRPTPARESLKSPR